MHFDSLQYVSELFRLVEKNQNVLCQVVYSNVILILRYYYN